MKVIGICGGSGSGKGTVCSVFAELGIPSVDTDAVYHDLTSRCSPCLDELAREFGEEIIIDGRLDRARLREIVFTPPTVAQRQARLNEITHKYVIERTEQLLDGYEKGGARGAIIDAPLLYESGLDKRCDCVIAVVADREVRLARILLRDGITYEAASRRINAQLTDIELRARADIVIENNGSYDALRREVARVCAELFEN